MIKSLIEKVIQIEAAASGQANDILAGIDCTLNTRKELAKKESADFLLSVTKAEMESTQSQADNDLKKAKADADQILSRASKNMQAAVDKILQSI
ncbi:MAG: hypothetical protein FWD86_00840 [Firmicutes bacterium]|nr:hypothetical protein [Bacillota bacterium]